MENVKNVDGTQVSTQVMDRESLVCLDQMTESQEAISNRISSVKFVLVLLSAKGIVFDVEALRRQIVLAYPDAVVFFQTTIGKPIGAVPPGQIDLLIDFTGPGQRQAWGYARKLRKMARIAVGRNAGFFRKRLYDRVFDEIENSSKIPQEILARERYVQKRVLNLAGISFLQAGETPPDRGKSIALELPGIQRL